MHMKFIDVHIADLRSYSKALLSDLSKWHQALSE